MRGCFHTLAPHSFCLHAPNPLAALVKIVPNACSITRQLLSLSSAPLVAPPPPPQSGAAHAGTYGTTARNIGRHVLPLAQASDPIAQGCAERLPSLWGTSRTPGSLAPCEPISLLLTCRPLGTALCFLGLLLLFLPCRRLAVVATLVVPFLSSVKLVKLCIPLGELLATSQPDARTILCPILMLLWFMPPPLATLMQLLPRVISAPMMRAIYLFGQAGSLEPPKGSSLAASSVLTCPRNS